ncbi:TetR/AcrR family transcriptional regulator [Streptacidiphilus pinicola]|uniref:TetR/AcrR family transcriptional regulator n=1 Tax=Streptacidiphilus pinicola TaxID=2219663 RepID=A0A2X0IQ68_9ACTN|nr:TetR/AcrR family transcriptional regulator [Streptacidiphilus pinicola]RAG87362.1 TetR/AcrR family transcriptional regulator [Streptacidiphilus pinicola]
MTRQRDPEARRTAILDAARYCFGRHAYADTTIGAIAERAGVSAALVIKYFGNKEQLFQRVFSFADDAAALLDAPLEELSQHMVLHVLAVQQGEARDPILRIAFSRQHEDRGAQARADFKTSVVDGLAARLSGPDRALRAELAVGVLLGLGALLAMVQADALTRLTPDEVVARYRPLLDPLLLPA